MCAANCDPVSEAEFLRGICRVSAARGSGAAFAFSPAVLGNGNNEKLRMHQLDARKNRIKRNTESLQRFQYAAKSLPHSVCMAERTRARPTKLYQ